MADFERKLVLKADGKVVEGSFRMHLSGRESIGLYPMPYMLHCWNLDEDTYLLLSRSGQISVEHDLQVLAAGDVADVFRYITEDGTVTAVCFTLGLKLWEAPVSLSLEAGVSVSETVAALLEASGTGISLLTYTGSDPLAVRGQAFFGRAAESLAVSLSAANARGYLVESGLCVLPEEDPPVSLVISEEDMLTDPEFPNGDLAVFRLKVAGWQIGKKIEAHWGMKSLKGIILERMVDADNSTGPWYSEILVEVRRGE